MIKTFNELWEACENISKNDQSMASIIDEIIMKLTLYKMVDLKKQISAEENKIAKSRILGEILLSITKISIKDNINVFSALYQSFTERNT